MKALTLTCLAWLCVALCSCGGSAKTSGMSFEDFKAKLKSMEKPFEGPCEACNGTGTVTDADEGTEQQCPQCQGTGKVKGIVHPPLADFEAAFGKPMKEENRPGDPIWEYWYFRCSEGTIRLHAYHGEKRGDVVRAVTSKVELIK